MFSFLAIWSIGVSAYRPHNIKPELEEDANEDEAEGQQDMNMCLKYLF